MHRCYGDEGHGAAIGGSFSKSIYPNGKQVIYTYDKNGNIKTATDWEGRITTYEYDKTNRLIKYNGKEVKYDKDGNMVYGPLNGEMAGFTYDWRNRLVQAGATKYEYDAEDNRTAVIKNAGTKEEVRTEYVVDSVEELSRVLMAVERKSGYEAAGNSMKNTIDNESAGSETANTTASTTGNEAFQTTYFYICLQSIRRISKRQLWTGHVPVRWAVWGCFGR